MGIKELRIGNFVHRNDLIGHYDRIEKIIFLNEKATVTGPINVICDYDDLNPIPLTEEWIGKLGLVYDENEKQVFLVKYSFYIRKDHEEGTYEIYENVMDSFITEVNYVHQLQNLYFALIGEELKITNNKDNG